MGNRHYSETHPDRLVGGSPKPKAGRKASGKMPEKTAAWPGLPGKAQPRDRSAGVKKCKSYVKSEGL